MALLTGEAIKEAIERGEITIDPYREENIGPNSYDLTLSNCLLTYEEVNLDCARKNRTRSHQIPEEGIILAPGRIYLGATVEHAKCPGLIPVIEGRSSTGRLGIRIHATAGKGDLGFEGHWTLEIDVVEPIKIYAGMRVCQLYFLQPVGGHNIQYKGKYQHSKEPQPSKLWMEVKCPNPIKTP